jgi:hypothetical protein
VTPPEVLARFANNPFALLRAAVAGGVFDRGEAAGKVIPAFQLVGRSTPVDRVVVELAVNRPQRAAHRHCGPGNQRGAHLVCDQLSAGRMPDAIHILHEARALPTAAVSVARPDG